MATERDDAQRDEADRDDEGSRNPRTSPVPPEGELPAEFVGGPENMPGSQEPPPEVLDNEPVDEDE